MARIDYTGMTFDPSLGRFVTVDPNEVSEIQFADGVTRTVGEIMEAVVTPAGQNTSRDTQFTPVIGGSVINPIASSIFGGDSGGGFNPANIDDGLDILHAFSDSAYGSRDLGVIRRSSEALENEPSGIRPGTMERIVIPAWARNQRGTPI